MKDQRSRIKGQGSRIEDQGIGLGSGSKSGLIIEQIYNKHQTTAFLRFPRITPLLPLQELTDIIRDTICLNIRRQIMQQQGEYEDE